MMMMMMMVRKSWDVVRVGIIVIDRDCRYCEVNLVK